MQQISYRVAAAKLLLMREELTSIGSGVIKMHGSDSTPLDKIFAAVGAIESLMRHYERQETR